MRTAWTPVRWATWGLVTAAVGAAAIPAAAEGIPRQRAERIALRELKPKRDNPNVAIFGSARPLGRRAVVSSLAYPSKAPGSRVRVAHRARRLGRPAWLFWRDQRYGADFAKPSTLLLVDDRSGRVRKRSRLQWWPLVNGRPPRFIRSRRLYLSERRKILSPLDLVDRRLRTAEPRRSAPRADRGGAGKAPPAAFKDDCLVSLYHVDPEAPDDDHFLRNVEAMEAFAGEVGIRSFRVTGENGKPATEHDYFRAVDRVVLERDCKDVVLFISAHGNEAGDVVTGSTTRLVNAGGKHEKVDTTVTRISERSIRRGIADRFQDATFKVKVDTCYAGNYLSLINLPNVLIVEAASRADQVSYGYKRDNIVKRDPNDPFKWYVVKNPYNPEHLAEFTYANLVGMRRFVSRPDEVQYGWQQAQAQGTSFLAWMLSRAFLLGENRNFTATQGLTDPQIATSFQPSPPP